MSLRVLGARRGVGRPPLAVTPAGSLAQIAKTPRTRTCRRSSNQAVVRAVTSLAADLGIDSLAEGLETPGELNTAVRLGCQLGQGYHLGRPATPDQIILAAAEPVGLPRDLDLLLV